MNYTKYPDFLKNNVLNNKNIELHYARLNTTPGKLFLKELLSFQYIKEETKLSKTTLNSEKNIKFNRSIMNLYRKYWGNLTSKIRWLAEEYLHNPWEKVKVLTRNHAMRPYVKALEEPSNNFVDLLQEYFIPLSKFEEFTEDLAHLIKKYNIKLMNITLRWTPKNTESFLSYSQEDSIAFVLYFTTKKTAIDIQNIAQFSTKITDKCLKYKGTFYLPYQQFASKKQLLEAYPQLFDFIKKKNEYDPLGTFNSNWYQNYILKTIQS